MTPLHLTATGSDHVLMTAIVATTLTAWVACWYANGLSTLCAHPQGRRQQRLRAPLLMIALVVLLLVSLPPLGEHLEERMSTHMAQHVVILAVVAPLLAVARPGQVLLAGTPTSLRRRTITMAHRLPWHGGNAAVASWLLSVAALWLWHLPRPYDAAVRSDAIHVAEHICFLLSAWLFWVQLVRLARGRRSRLAAATYVAAAVPPGAALGAVLTFADHPLYPAQAAATTAQGTDPMLDQRVAGLVMWVPLDIAYLAVAIVLFALWFGRLEGAGGRGLLPADARAHVEGLR